MCQKSDTKAYVNRLARRLFLMLLLRPERPRRGEGEQREGKGGEVEGRSEGVWGEGKAEADHFAESLGEFTQIRSTLRLHAGQQM